MRKNLFKTVIKSGVAVFVVSFIIISIIGAYLGVKGNQVPISHWPTQPYEEVSFPTQARDTLTLGGWFFPSDSDHVVVIVHGWGGHRARFLLLHTTGDELSPIAAIYSLQHDVAARHQTNITFMIIPGFYHNFMDQDPDHGFYYSQKIVNFIHSLPPT